MTAQEPMGLITDANVGIALFLLMLIYMALIIVIDSNAHGKLVISRSLSLYLVDAIGFASGMLILFALYEPKIFNIVGSNAIYLVTTGMMFTLGPIIKLAERGGRAID